MKLVLLTVFFAFIMVVSGEPRPEFSEKYCHSSEDCDTSECCVTTGIFGILKGRCQSLSQEGDPCTPEDDVIGLFHRKKYQNYCPCEGDLSCEAKDVQDLGKFGKILMNERCVQRKGTDDITTTERVTCTEEEVETTEEELGTTEEELGTTDEELETTESKESEETE